MNCNLYKYIDHSKIRDKFRHTYFQCPLFKSEDAGMSALGVVCGGCCIRLNQLHESKKVLLLTHTISVEDYKRDPGIIEEHLPAHLKQYHKALTELGKNVEDVSSECNRCKGVPSEVRPLYAEEATEMTTRRQSDLR